MEYLTAINNPLNNINETNIQYLNIFNNPSLVYGNPLNSDKVDFCKYTQEIQDDMVQFGPFVNNAMQHFKTASCGCRIRFRTTSRKLVFRVEFKRSAYFSDIVGWNAFGFEIYVVDSKGHYTHHRLMAPQDGFRIFADQIPLPPNSAVCIFLPNFNTILNMRMGIERGSRITKFPYPKNKRTPILFYGGSIAQGASASKSGNSYPNIVSRNLNQDIINLSIKHCCKATDNTAKFIGSLDCDSIVIDYSKEVPNEEIFSKTYERFYKNVRKYHPDKKIILLTTPSFNRWKEYESFDDIIIKTYEKAIARGENTLLLNQKELFDKKEYDLISIENNQFTDYGMYEVANKLCELLKT